MENNLLPVLTGDGLTKKQIEALAEQAVGQALDGRVDILRVAEGISALETFLKQIKGDPTFSDEVRAKLEAYPKGKLESVSGAKLEVCETAVTYDYSHDSTWVELKAEADEANARLKAWQEKMQKIPAGKVLVDEESGEVIVGAAKSSKSSYKVTLKKQ